MPQRPASATPFAGLLDSCGRTRRRTWGSWALARERTLQVVTQLGVPPTLAYLRDGIERSIGCLATFGGVLDHCLRMVPGALLTAELADELRALLIWIDSQGWPVGDPRLAEMGRRSGDAPHPLDRYALSVCHHWSLLFYVLNPAVVASASGADQRYEALVQEFSMYVLAAQSAVAPEDYFAYCEQWLAGGQQPDWTFYPSSRLASRVADAALAIRRLSNAPDGRLLAALTDPGCGAALADRVAAARYGRWPRKQEQALDAIDRLLEDVALDWHRPASGSSGGGKGRHAPQRMQRRHFQDGYVRISQSACITSVRETDLGAVAETVVQTPVTVEELTAELLKRAGPVDPAGLILASGDRAKDARKVAEAQLDGQEWLPVAEAVPDGGVDALVLPESESERPARPGVRPGTASRWAADWLRRMHMAHPLVPDRLDLEQMQNLLHAMADPEKIGPENAAAAVCLHAAIALGRPLEAGCTLEIHDSLQHTTLQPKRIHYGLAERQWALFAPPPAWGATPVAACERSLWPQVRLIDRTGFLGMLQAHGLAHSGMPVGRLSEVRRTALLRWVGGQLAGVAAPADACRDFLFYRLLAVTRGDLGLARLITGREHAHSATVAHYAYYRAEVVWNAYRRCWQEDADVPDAAAKPSPAESEPVAAKRHGYGARRVPEAAAVRQLVEWLRERIRHSAGAERHNLYTAYTWAGLVLGTAMRPLTTVVIHDPAVGIGRYPITTFADKARTDYHRRVTALPAALATHLERYARYLRTLDIEMSEVNTVGNAAALPFRYCDEGNENENRHEGKERKNIRWRAFRPSDFERLCGSAFGLELYALRRFVRTELAQDEGLTAEDVDAWMGHWFDGLSPADRLSTYPMARLQQVAGGAAARLLARVSFKPLWIDQQRGL